MYRRLAWHNLRHNSKFYLPYLFTIVGTAAVFYIMTALASASDLPKQLRYAYLSMFMTIGMFVVGLFTIIFLFYTKQFNKGAAGTGPIFTGDNRNRTACRLLFLFLTFLCIAVTAATK